MNPLIVIDNNLEENKLFLKHEVIHIIAQHFMRIEELKDKYPKCLALLASDLVANQILKSDGERLDPKKFWVEETMKEYFDIDMKIKADDTVEELIGFVRELCDASNLGSDFVNSFIVRLDRLIDLGKYLTIKDTYIDDLRNEQKRVSNIVDGVDLNALD